MSKNVKLGIRVRPFSERERRSEKDRVPVVNVVDENKVSITNIKVSVSGAGDSRERVRQYYADYTFDSACPVTDPAYASQEKVFEAIGRDVLASVSRGVSACVLAYGQSSTGKTHTMMGTEFDPGLIPRLCAAFGELQFFDVTVSFLEIYNERVHDLLGEVGPVTCHSLPRRRGNARKDLRVREHPDKGPYVQNLRRVAVHDVATLLSLVKEGTSRRRTAATRRNSTSSRSHALLELTISNATLHLADLAGSEKASWEGCGGGRQKEGANINKSLVALSNVISALVTGGSGRGRFVPYRDSALTWLLKDCFTGGANTFIIATVSPSFACYGESASTLRWAARARQLPTPRTINTSSNSPSRAALQTQLAQLLAELTRNHIRYIPETGKILYDDKHWTLHVINKDIVSLDGSNKITKIGSIMDLLHPKADAQSESTASSVASGSSDVINTMDKNAEIENEIRKEVDKLFAPSLERTNSGGDLKVIAPLRHKRRQYKSQEVLPIDNALRNNSSQSLANALPSQSEQQINTKNTNNVDKLKITPIPILYDSQRAEIVASVTERLYSKLKKKEEAAVSKMEAVVDKKIMEPLSELRICTNARQRLIELSHKAVRNKRRIGIPAHTQTRVTCTRMRDQSIDVQTDLEAYVYRNRRFYSLQRDASTITETTTPRCKEVAVGSRYGTLDFRDKSTITDSDPVMKSSTAMTDILLKSDRSTQTPIVPPPRRKKRMSTISKYLKNIECKKHCLEESSTVKPVININISHAYSTEKESQSSDDSVELPNQQTQNKETTKVTMTPDLLTNHSTIDLDSEIPNEINQDQNTASVCKKNETSTIIQHNNTHSTLCEKNSSDEFPDFEDYSLPRVTVDTSIKSNHEEMKNIILGRNKSVYPYNIVLSPPKGRENLKRIVTFKDLEISPITSVASQTGLDWDSKSCTSNKSNPSSENIQSFEKECNRRIDLEVGTASDSTECSKMDTDSFIWKKGIAPNKTMGYSGRNYTPVYKSNSRYRTAKARLYKEFLGLEKNVNDYENNHVNRVPSCESTDIEEGSQFQFKQRRKFFEDTFRFDYLRNDFEKLELEILDSCDSLEKTVNKYDNYLSSLPSNGNRCSHRTVPLTYGTPTEYLQHLVQLRREVVKADCDTDSSLGIPNK